MAACQRQCDPPESCKCHRCFIHVIKLEEWMKSTASDGPTDDANKKKGARLLAEMHDRIKHHTMSRFPLLADTLLTGENRCSFVFALLLKQGLGHLVDLFERSKTYDRTLSLRCDQYDAKHPSLRNTLEKFLREISKQEIDNIITAFENEKWEYCAPLEQFKLHMQGDFDGTKVILPFCRCISVNKKGGTASVFWVAVQEDLISDTKLREALEISLYNNPEYGQVRIDAPSPARTRMSGRKTHFPGSAMTIACP